MLFKVWQNSVSILRLHLKTLGIFLFLLVILLINNTHVPYTDEFDNIFGGFLINHGVLPYTGFFSDHGPMAYFFASAITLISGKSFILFRVILAFVYAISSLYFLRFIREKFGWGEAKVIGAWIFTTAFCLTFFYGHLFVADNLAGLFLLGAYVTLFFCILRDRRIALSEISMVSLLTSAALLTSLTYVFAGAVIYIFLLLTVISQKSLNLSRKDLIKILLILSGPYIIFFLYLLITFSLKEFYIQAIVFIKDYYVGFNDGVQIKNPLRFAVYIFQNFFVNFKALILSAKDTNFGNPFAVTLGLANLMLIIYTLITKRIKLAFLIILMMVYVSARSNPLTVGENDYQSAPYIFISLFNGIFLLPQLWQGIKGGLDGSRTFLFKVMIVVLGIYVLFFSLFIFNKWLEKSYKKYMGLEPLIYDRPSVAPIFNNVLSQKDYYFVGPYDPENNLNTNAKLPSKYFFILPPMDRSEEIKNQVIRDFKQNKPKLVIFNTDYHIFGKKPGEYLVSYLRENYVTLAELKQSGVLKYSVPVKYFGYFQYDLENHFFILKDYQNEIVEKLIKYHYINLVQAL